MHIYTYIADSNKGICQLNLYKDLRIQFKEKPKELSNSSVSLWAVEHLHSLEVKYEGKGKCVTS